MGPATRDCIRVVPNIVHGLTTTVARIATTDAMILGSIAGVGAIGLGFTLPIAAVAAMGGFLIGFLTFNVAMMRVVLGRQASDAARFPTPDVEP